MQEVNGYTGDCKNDSIPGIFPESVALSWWRETGKEEQIRLILYDFMDVPLEDPNMDIKVKKVLNDQEIISVILWTDTENFRGIATEVMAFLPQRVIA